MGSVEILTEKFEKKSDTIAPLDIDMALDDVKKMKGDPAHAERLGKLRQAIEKNKDKFQRSADIDAKLALLQKELPERSFVENAKNAAIEATGDVMGTVNDIKERAEKGDYKGMITEHPYIASFLAWTGLKWVSKQFLSFISSDDEKKEAGPIRKMFGYAVDAVGITALAKLIEQYSDTKNTTPAQPNPAPAQPPNAPPVQPNPAPAQPPNAPPKSTDPVPNAPNQPQVLALKDIPKGSILNKTQKIAKPNGQPVELTLKPENLILNGNKYVMSRSLGVIEKRVLQTNQDAVPITIESADWDGKEISVNALAKYKKKNGADAERKDTGKLDAASVAQILEKSGQPSFKIDQFEFKLAV